MICKILSSKGRNKRLQCYDWWTKRFQSTSKKKKKHMISHKQNEGRNINDNATMFFVIEEAILDFSQGTVKVLWFYFILIQYQ